MNEELTKQIIATTYTLHKLRKRIRLLKEFLNHKLYQNGAVSENIDAEDQEWLQTIAPYLQGVNHNNIDQFINSLEQIADKTTPLIIYTARELPQKEVLDLGVWVRKNINPTLFVDVKLDPSLLAGCALVWNSIYRDYSLRKRIEDNKEEILKSFKSFIR